MEDCQEECVIRRVYGQGLNLTMCYLTRIDKENKEMYNTEPQKQADTIAGCWFQPHKYARQ